MSDPSLLGTNALTKLPYFPKAEIGTSPQGPVAISCLSPATTHAGKGKFSAAFAQAVVQHAVGTSVPTASHALAPPTRDEPTLSANEAPGLTDSPVAPAFVPARGIPTIPAPLHDGLADMTSLRALDTTRSDALADASSFPGLQLRSLRHHVGITRGRTITAQLLAAARDGNAVKARQLLQAGAAANVCDDKGRHVAVIAASTGSPEVLKLLLDTNTLPVDVLNAALQGALENYRAGLQSMLVAAGADMNAVDIITRLHCAARCQDLNSMGHLIAAGADVNAKDKHGTPVLTVCFECVLPSEASSRGQCEAAVALLLDAHADIHAVNAWGASVLWRAMACEHRHVVALLLERGADVELHQSEGDVMLLKYLQKRGLVIHEGETGGSIPELLIAAGADVNKHQGRQTPLHAALVRHLPNSVISCLVEAGARVNDRFQRTSGSSQTPVMTACTSTRRNAHNSAHVKRLIQAGACPHSGVSDEVGRVITPLTVAVTHNNVDLITLLLGAGAIDFQYPMVKPAGAESVQYILDDDLGRFPLPKPQGADTVVAASDATSRMHCTVYDSC